MNISAFFIRRPIPGILLFILLSLAGIFGFSKMTVKLFPDVDAPIIVVYVTVPGALPEQLEHEVGRKIENKLASLDGLKHTYTELFNNLAKVTVEFRIEKPVQQALDDVRSAVNEVRGDFPDSAEDPIITKFNINDAPLFIFSISSTDLDAVDLSWFVDNDLNKALLGIQGVDSVSRIGGVEREIQVLVEPETLHAYKTTVGTISQQLSIMQRDFSGGKASIGEREQPIRTNAAVSAVDDLDDIVLPLSNGVTAKLSDLASVKDAFKEQTSKALLNGEEGVAFIIFRSKGYGDLEVGKLVRDKLATIQREHHGLKITEVFESVTHVQQDYSGALKMLAEGALLAVFVVLLFLGGMSPTLFFALALGISYFIWHHVDASWTIFVVIGVLLTPVIVFFDRFRATLIAATALPLSILPAFAGMYFMDISMNLMVTLALSLVIGILVDDAIVEVENIDRHMHMGKTPIQASIEATDEIGTAVIAITMTLIAVFLPTAFMPGIAGKFFYQFGVAASLSIFSSLLVARIITPIMAAYFLKPLKHEVHDPFWMKPYLLVAKWAIKLRWITMVCAIGFFVFSLMLMSTLPKGFIPANDATFTQVKIELPPGGKLVDTLEVAENARKAIADIPHIKRIFSYVGGRDVRNATLFLTLTERGTRPKKRLIENDMRERLATVAGAKFTVTSGGNGEIYEMVLSSDNSYELNKAAQAVIRDLRQVKGLGSISNSAGLLRQELIITPNYAKAAEYGVNSADIARTIRIATVGDFESNLPKFNAEQRQIPIVTKLPDDARADISILSDLLVLGRKGPVRIGDVATLQIGAGPSEIKRYDRQRYVKLNIEIKSGELGEIKSQIEKLPSIKNLPASVKQIAIGDAEVMQELAESFSIAMGVAIICIYFVLILLFGQLSQPVTILVALPLSIGGAVLGLIIVNAGVSLPAMIGLLMLMGIAVKNSILLVEYTINKRKEVPEMKRMEALLDACHKRARPIIMTTIAMGAGMVPLILGLGEADPSFRRPMAAAVFGGLMTSTILSLLVIPAFYTIVEDVTTLPKKVLKRFTKMGDKAQPS